jgi:hypothetical protein
LKGKIPFRENKTAQMAGTVDLILTRSHYSDLHINQRDEAQAANKAIITGSFTAANRKVSLFYEFHPH